MTDKLTIKQMWNIGKLKNWPDNPREIKTEKFSDLKESLKQEGQLMPLLVDMRPEHQGEVIGGNMTLRALKELGYKEVWVEPKTPRDDAHAFEIAIKHNMRYGQYAQDLLLELSEKYKDILDLSKLDVDLKEPPNLQDLLDQFKPIEEDEVPEVEEVAISKLGEVYTLGRHRLMCGDSTDAGSVALLMNGQKADMVFTDPPYNVDYGGEQSPIWKKTIKKIENDNLTASGWLDFCNDTAAILATYNNGPIYVCHAPGPDGRVIASILDKIFHWSATIIWKKDRLIPGRGHFQRQYEPIWYGWKGEHKEQSDRTATDVWEIKRPFSNDLHPTMKPIELVSKAILFSSYENQTILDIFGGSGSTLIACEQTNRICYMMEIDPKYCDVIRKRYEQFTNK